MPMPGFRSAVENRLETFFDPGLPNTIDGYQCWAKSLANALIVPRWPLRTDVGLEQNPRSLDFPCCGLAVVDQFLKMMPFLFIQLDDVLFVHGREPSHENGMSYSYG